MDINTAKNAARDLLAVWHGGDGTPGTQANMVVRKWENVNTQDVENAVSYLRTYTAEKNGSTVSGSVADLLVGKNELNGVWRGGKVSHKREDDGTFTVFQELHEGYVTTLGTGGAVDWSEFFLLRESGYHANHEMPVLRLNNVAPSAVHDLVAYLNQDTFTDMVFRDDTLSGTWRRVEVLAEQDEDGSYHIDVLLTDSANTDLYVRFLESSNVWKGIYHKWDATDTTIEELESTIQFSATGEIVESGGKTLRETVAGRTVKWLPARRASDTRLFELVAEILWVREETLHDYARTTNVPNVDEDGETLPRTGNAIVSQWWERGNNTDKLPEKPSVLYDPTDGTYMEEYIMQSPPEIVNGRYNWILNCRRVELPTALLDDSLKPKWVRHAIQSRTDKTQNTVSIDSQTVMRLINGLIDDPPEDTANIGIAWLTAWDHDPNGAYGLADVVYDETTQKWYECILGHGPGAGIAVTNTTYWKDATTTAPATWDSDTYGVWSNYYGKTWIDSYNSFNVLWDDDWTVLIGSSENELTSWTDYQDAGNGIDVDENLTKEAWDAEFYPSAGLGGTGGAGGDLIWFNRALANSLDANDPTVAVGWEEAGANSLTLTVDGYPFYNVPVDQSVNAQAGMVLKINQIKWDNISEGTGYQTLYFYLVSVGVGTGVGVLLKGIGTTTSDLAWVDGGVVQTNTLTQYGTTVVGTPATCRVFNLTNSGNLIKKPEIIKRADHTPYVGNRLYTGSVEFFAGSTSTAGGTWTHSIDTVSDRYGYPFQLAFNSNGLNFYLKREYLFPDFTIDPNERSNFALLPRFSYGKDKYANPNLVEIVRRTRRLVQTEIYRKYCAVHPSMIANSDKYIPSAFADDAHDWPTDPDGSGNFWIDSNILIKYRTSDAPINVMGGQLYYVECTIEYYGEEEADARETSARDDATLRNFPDVDPQTGLALIYSTPREVDSLFVENQLPAGGTRQAPNRLTKATKMIDYFEIREDAV